MSSAEAPEAWLPSSVWVFCPGLGWKTALHDLWRWMVPLMAEYLCLATEWLASTLWASVRAEKTRALSHTRRSVIDAGLSEE